MKANTLDPMHKKRYFPLKSSLVNVSKTADNHIFVVAYWEYFQENSTIWQS